MATDYQTPAGSRNYGCHLWDVVFRFADSPELPQNPMEFTERVAALPTRLRSQVAPELETAIAPPGAVG